MIPYGQHFIDEEDIQAVVELLRTGYLTQGPKIIEFEKTVAQYVGAKFAVATSSGTTALHLACIAAGIEPGDNLITSPNTFVASSNCAIYVGAIPHFADIHPETLNIDSFKLKEKLNELGRVKAIIPVHFAGFPCEMPVIKKIADDLGANIIEDGAHAFGASYPDGGKVGNCAHSLMTVFSFHPVKMITSGEGGIITTNDEDCYRNLLRFRSHGINKGNDPFIDLKLAFDEGKVNPWYYEMQYLGFNYRITDIQCALAISQMKKLDQFVMKRREIAIRYDEAFADLPYLMKTQVEGRDLSSHHLYVVRIQFEELGISRRELMAKLASLGVGSHVHYIPVPMQPYYREHYQIPERDYREANQYYQEALTLPIFPSMKEEEISNVINSVKSICLHEYKKSLNTDRRLRLDRQATR